jgi:hypothetical protein
MGIVFTSGIRNLLPCMGPWVSRRILQRRWCHLLAACPIASLPTLYRDHLEATVLAEEAFDDRCKLK